MRIFDEILKQYMQVALKSKQYKINMQNLSNVNLPNIINDNTDIKTFSDNYNTVIKTSKSEYNTQPVNMREFYNKLEFDARRYNRNFDSQTGVVAL